MTALTEEAIRAGDPAGMVADVLAQPGQLADALWRVESAGIGRRESAGLCVCGMGGSAIGADLAVAVLGERALKPIRTVRGYALPPGLEPDTLVLCSSYSSSTEETLSCFDAAAADERPIVALTTGGELARRARDYGAPVVGVPSGMQPRAAVVYMTVCTLAVAAACGAAPALDEEISGAASLLSSLVDEWGPSSPSESRSKQLAMQLHGTVPVIHGAGSTDPIATRWKAQINENAKLPAFRSTLPEADHNEICGWDASPALAPFSAVFLDDPALDARLRARVALTADTIDGGAAQIERVEAIGDTAAERVLSLVLLGDLVSVYLAVLAGVDPTPVEPIERFKRALADATAH